MEIKLFKVAKDIPEEIDIRYHNMTDEVRDIVSFAKTRQGKLCGITEGNQYEIPITDVYYIEAVDNKVFLYTQNNVYEIRSKLYELENLLKNKYFLRVSKSLLLNLMKIKSIKPALNGRFTAILNSKEEIVISRKYANDLKNALKGGI